VFSSISWTDNTFPPLHQNRTCMLTFSLFRSVQHGRGIGFSLESYALMRGIPLVPSRASVGYSRYSHFTNSAARRHPVDVYSRTCILKPHLLLLTPNPLHAPSRGRPRPTASPAAFHLSSDRGPAVFSFSARRLTLYLHDPILIFAEDLPPFCFFSFMLMFP